MYGRSGSTEYVMNEDRLKVKSLSRDKDEISQNEEVIVRDTARNGKGGGVSIIFILSRLI